MRTEFFACVVLAAVATAPAAKSQAPDDVLLSVEAELPRATLDDTTHRLGLHLEQGLRDVPGVAATLAITRAGHTRVILRFRLSQDRAAAVAAVERRIAALRSTMPLRTVGPRVAPPAARQPAAWLALFGDRFAAFDLNALYARHVAGRMPTVPGVAAIEAYGVRARVLRLRLDPARLAAYGLTADAVAAELRQRDLAPRSAAGGLLLLPDTATSPGPEAIADIVVKLVSGAAIRLRDFATLERGLSPAEADVRYDGRPAIVAALFARPGSDPADTTRTLRDGLAALKPSLPAGLETAILYTCARCALERR
ncbi:MAG: efflux RND transporter permease subunit [Rhodospirillaceae bacterium]|nr:efflux RND transporter permease subunit [Rhodospirillaceae bacterium]